MMEIAAKNKKVRKVDCCEFNPVMESYMSSRGIRELSCALAMGLGDREME